MSLKKIICLKLFSTVKYLIRYKGKVKILLFKKGNIIAKKNQL